jgi:dTDP-4-dehydrorhamnose reductase
MKVLVLGVSGMLGHTAFRVLREEFGLIVHGAGRSAALRRFFPEDVQEQIHTGVDVNDWDALIGLLVKVRPDAVVNCVGIVKQLASAKDPLVALPINSLLPHRLARACALMSARLVHISTDCVFSGKAGGYTEDSPCDAEDLYGRSKLLGEVISEENAVTLRTSIIGPELASRNGLVNWFLSTSGQVPGFTRSIFSGLTTNELSRVIGDRVLARPGLHGLWHVSSRPISKYDLLETLRSAYRHPVDIAPDPSLIIDRSLDSSRFQAETGYKPPDWTEMVTRMRESDK